MLILNALHIDSIHFSVFANEDQLKIVFVDVLEIVNFKIFDNIFSHMNCGRVCFQVVIELLCKKKLFSILVKLLLQVFQTLYQILGLDISSWVDLVLLIHVLHDEALGLFRLFQLLMKHVSIVDMNNLCL